MAKHARVGPADTAAERPVNDVHRPAGPTVAARHAAAARLTGPRIAGIAAAVVICLAVGAFMIVSGVNLSSADPAAAQAPITSSSGESKATSVASRAPAMTAQLAAAAAPSPTDRSAPADATDPPPIRMPETGPGITQPGILLLAWPSPDGSFEVIERVRPVGTVSDVTLRPASVDRAGQQFASSSAAAKQVRLTAGGKDVTVPGAEIGARTILAVGQVDRFDLRYRLTDVTVLSSPSTSGRALAALGPLTGAMNQDLPVLIVAAGDSVLGLSCPLLPLSEQSCGSRLDNGPGFRRELPSPVALTMVQFNVPST
jgi:hypothetical protein